MAALEATKMTDGPRSKGTDAASSAIAVTLVACEVFLSNGASQARSSSASWASAVIARTIEGTYKIGSRAGSAAVELTTRLRLVVYTNDERNARNEPNDARIHVRNSNEASRRCTAASWYDESFQELVKSAKFHEGELHPCERWSDGTEAPGRRAELSPCTQGV